MIGGLRVTGFRTVIAARERIDPVVPVLSEQIPVPSEQKCRERLARESAPAPNSAPRSVYASVVLGFDLLSGVGVFFVLAAWGSSMAGRTGTHLAVAAGFAVFAALIRCGVMALGGCYDKRFAGIGPEEFRRVGVSTLWVWGLIATGAYVFAVDTAPLIAASCVIATFALTVFFRLIARQVLYRARKGGRALTDTIVVGDDPDCEFLNTLKERPIAGFRPAGKIGSPAADADVNNWLDDVCALIEQTQATSVSLTHSVSSRPDLVRRIALRLAGPEIDLMIEPAHGQVSVPRVAFRPAPGLPAFHLDEPALATTSRFTKRLTDIVLAVTAIIVFAPLMGVAALAIRLSGPGPVFYRELRVGHHGTVFTLWKLRTMYEGADQHRAAVIGEADSTDLDKYRADPRVTPVGRILRRWSIDEMPQFMNVLAGKMSIVGPRPMSLTEVPLLEWHDHGRHLARPGITGLWQVSGRKAIEWDDRMRIDLFYIEKWSLVLDVVIMMRTFKAVLAGHGAV